MRVTSQAFDAEVAATTVGDTLEVNAWRGGVLLEQALAVTGWNLSWDATRQVQGQGTFTVADPDGRLAPWGLSDALGPGGSRLQVTWVSGLSGTRVPLGWWRIRKADPDETWRLIPATTPTATLGPVARTNRVTNPAYETNLTGWGVNVATASRVTTGGVQGPAFLRLTATTTASAWAVLGTGTPLAGVDLPVTVSVWARAKAGQVFNLRLTYSGGAAGAPTSPDLVGTGAWARYSWATNSGPSGRTSARPDLRVSATGTVAGDTLDLDGWLLEVGPAAPGGTIAVGSYFDGSTPDTSQTRYAWTGTAHASTSTLSPIVVTYASRAVRVAGGGSVRVQADEETATVALSRLDAEVVTAPTCLAEIRRLLADIGPVVVFGVPDGPVPAAMVYGDSRADAVDDLLTSVQAVMRMGSDGSFEVVPAAGVGPVWTLAGGPDGVLVSTVRALSDDGVYNAATSTGESATGQPLVGRVRREGGPLAWGGPFGKVPVFHSAVAQTVPGVQADAATTLATLTAAGEVDLAVTCLAHPGVQPNDRVTVLVPSRAGDAPLEGRVVGMTLASAGSTPAKSMALTVRVPADALEAIATRVVRTP